MKRKFSWFFEIIAILFLLTAQLFASVSQDLFKAIEKGNLEEVKSAIGKGANVNERDVAIGDTALVRAIRKGHLDIVKCLVEHGANVNEADVWNHTPLHKAVDHQDLNMVKFLIENGANINAKEKANGKTPLMEAVFWNNFDIVDYLLSKGADINEKDNRGETALDMAKQSGTQAIVNCLEGRPSEKKLLATEELVKAVEKGDLEGVKSALNKGADINVKVCLGWPLFVYAADRKYDVYGKNIEIAKYLIEQGANVNEKTEKGMTCLMFMANWGNFELVKSLVEKGAKINEKIDGRATALNYAAQNGNFDIVSYLVEKGAKIEKDNMGRTLLMDAVGGAGFAQEGSSSRLKIIEYLIEKGVDLNEKNSDGWSALTYAALEGASNIAKYLIEHGAKINEKDNEGRTPLMIAASQGHLNVVKCLVEAGANLDEKNNEGKTALDIAKGFEKLLIADYLANFSKDKRVSIDVNKLLLEAIQRGDIDTVKSALNRGAEVNRIDEGGAAPLLYAVILSKSEIVKYLIEQGADIKVRSKGFPMMEEEWDGPLLMLAIFFDRKFSGPDTLNGNFNIAKYLIEKGAKVNDRDKQGHTPLMFAVIKDNRTMVKYLVAKGAEINVKNNDGYTPLMLAVQGASYDIVKYLIEQGADIKVENKEGKTALGIAKDKSRYEIMDYLKNKANQ